MTSATLERELYVRPHHDDHSRTMRGLVETPVGVTEVLTELGPEPDVANQDLFVSGLFGNGAYGMPACIDAVQFGHPSSIMHLANNRLRNTLDADAVEVAGVTQELGAAGERVNYFAHSKGALVAIKAALDTDPDIDIGLIMLMNPAGIAKLDMIEMARHTPEFALEILGNAFRHPIRSMRANREGAKEMCSRGLGVMGEMIGLQLDQIKPDDIKRLHDRKHPPVIAMAVGAHDHLTVTPSILTAVKNRGLELDAVMTVDGLLAGGHLGVLMERDVFTKVASIGNLLVHAMRDEVPDYIVSDGVETTEQQAHAAGFELTVNTME
jgi:hypothetical protein